MKKSQLAISLLALLFSTCPGWADAPMLIPSSDQQQSLIIYNRILAKVNDQTISVIDVMKKMDLFLQKHYPEFVDSKTARFQFYSTQWRDTLAQMIDQELMLADAERLELKVTDAEVREEMLERFGPNIMATLDKLGLTYEETRTMIHSEMVVQRMMWFRVNSKALNTVNPQDIKLAYKEYCDKNPPQEHWKYEVLTVRSASNSLSETVAKKAFDLLDAAREDLTTAANHVKSESNDEDHLTVSVSPELDADENNIADAHKEVLKTLLPGMYSAPIAQISRVDQSMVYRIFHLKEHSKKEVPSFQAMADKLKEALLEQAFSKENTRYINGLRERLGYDAKQMLESLPEDFQPFALR